MLLLRSDSTTAVVVDEAVAEVSQTQYFVRMLVAQRTVVEDGATIGRRKGSFRRPVTKNRKGELAETR